MAQAADEGAPSAPHASPGSDAPVAAPSHADGAADGAAPSGTPGTPAALGEESSTAFAELEAPAGLPVRLDWRSGAWITAGVFVGLVLVGFFQNVPSSLTRIGVGVLLAFALDPLVGRLRARFGWSRPIAVGVVSGALVLLFGLLVFILGPPAVRQARTFGDELPRTVEGLYDLPIAGRWLEKADAAGAVERWAEDLPDRIDADRIEEIARTVLDGLVAAVVVMLVAIAVLVDGDRLVSRIKAAIPLRSEPTAVRIGQIFYRTVGAYFAGSLLVASLAAMFVLTVGLAFGVPLAPAAALWMLAVNLIPQVGGFLGGAFLGLLAFSQGADVGVIVVGLYILYNLFENHVITPAIVGNAVDLSPPATMLAALIGGAAAGVPGALVATPLVGAVKQLYLEVRWGRTNETQVRVAPWERWRRRRSRVRSSRQAPWRWRPGRHDPPG